MGGPCRRNLPGPAGKKRAAPGGVSEFWVTPKQTLEFWFCFCPNLGFFCFCRFLFRQNNFRQSPKNFQHKCEIAKTLIWSRSTEVLKKPNVNPGKLDFVRYWCFSCAGRNYATHPPSVHADATLPRSRPRANEQRALDAGAEGPSLRAPRRGRAAGGRIHVVSRNR